MAGFSTALSTGIATGTADAMAEKADAPFRAERLRQAQLMTKQAESNLAAAPTQQSNAEMQNQILQMQLRQAQGQQLKSQSFDAFGRYEADGDVKHLNNFYADAKKSDIGKSLFGGMVRVDAMTRTPETEKMLKSAGIEDLDGFFSDPEQVKSIVLTTGADGKKVLTDMNQVYVGTGYTNYVQDKELDSLVKRAQVNKLMRSGQSLENVTARERVAREMAAELKIPVWEAYQKIEGGSKGGSSTLERLTEKVMEENPDFSYLEAADQATQMLRSTESERRAKNLPGDPNANLEDIKRTQARTTAEKDVAASDAVRSEIDSLAGGSIFEADINDPALRRVIGPKITALEKLADTKLSTEDQRMARELRNLAVLGGTAGSELTDKETGPLDYILKSVKKYVVDDIGGAEATSNYEQFRNIFRNALYGASLTKTETDAFTKAAGSLYQQKGPVLAQLKTQLQSVKNNLSSIYDMNDPYIAQYYLGMDAEKIDRTIEALDERIKLVSGAGTGKETKEMITPTTTKKRTLDEIWAEQNR